MVEAKKCSITYDLPVRQAMPKVGEYIVTIGSKTQKPGTVYEITAVRLVRARSLRSFSRYKLDVTTCPGAIRFGHVIYQHSKKRVWVQGKRAHPLYWYPRTKKKNEIPPDRQPSA